MLIVVGLFLLWQTVAGAPAILLFRNHAASDDDSVAVDSKLRVALAWTAALAWAVFLVVWLVPFTVAVPIFGDPDPPTANCPPPIHYVVSRTGFARNCDATALDRVVAVSAVTLLISYGSMVAWSVYRDLTTWRARRAMG